MLHLLDAASPQAVPAAMACQAALKAADAGVRAVLLGGPPLQRMARQAGLNADGAFAPPLGRPWLNLHAAKQAVMRASGGEPAALTAWGEDSLIFARIAFPQVPAALMLLQNPAPGAWRRLTLLHRWRPFAWQAPRALLTGGALGEVADRLNITPVDLPQVSSGTPPPLDGFASIALAGLNANAWRGASVLGIAEAALGIKPGMKPGCRLRLHPAQPGLAHATRLVCALGQPERLAQATVMAMPWMLPADCKAVLVLAAPGGPDATQTLALPWLARQTRPIIAEDTPALRALLEGAVTVRWVRAGDMPALAHGCGEAG